MTIWRGLQLQTGGGATADQAEELRRSIARIGPRDDGIRQAAEFLDVRSLCTLAVSRLERLGG